jgi:hypothetical protein
LLGVFGGCVVVFLALCVLGLSALGSESKKVVDLKLKNQTADAQLTNLAVSKQEVEKYSYFKTVASSVIPTDKNQAEAVLEIFQLAKESGINIQSITFPNSSLGLTTAPTTTPAASAATPSAAATPTTQKIVSQSIPVVGIPGLYSVQLTITPDIGSQLSPDQQVTYPKMLDFLRRIENNRRTAQITQVVIQPLASAGPSHINFSLIVNIFIKP